MYIHGTRYSHNRPDLRGFLVVSYATEPVRRCRWVRWVPLRPLLKSRLQISLAALYPRLRSTAKLASNVKPSDAIVLISFFNTSKVNEKIVFNPSKGNDEVLKAVL